MRSTMDVVEYYKPYRDETPFEMGGEKWVYCWGKYPDGKIDIAVYRYATDLAYDYNDFRVAMGIDKDEKSLQEGVDRKEAQYLKKGDIITSGEEIVSVSSGAKTPSGKVEVTLKNKQGKIRTSVWGKTTKIGVKTNDDKKNINENMENTLNQKIAELKTIQTQLDEALKTYKESIADLETQKSALVPEVMDAFKGQTQGAEKLKISIDEMLVEIIQESEKLTTSYKDAFETALTKVNENTRKVLEQILENSKVASKVKGQLKIDGSKVFEGVEEMFGKVKQWLSNAYSRLTGFTKNAQDGVDEIEAMIKDYEEQETNKYAVPSMDDIESGAVREDGTFAEGEDKPMEEGGQEEVKEEGSFMKMRAGAEGKVYEEDEKLNEAINRFKKIINYI